MNLAPSDEWLCTLIQHPHDALDEDGEPYRPETLVWMAAESRVVLRVDVGRAGEMLPRLAESFASAVKAPMIGPKHAPKKVRVATPELEATFRAALPALEVTRAPTPEFDEVVKKLIATAEEGEPEPSAQELGDLFRAAAELFRAAPWKVVPTDSTLLEVTCEALGLDRAVVSVIGQLGESLGFLLFDSVTDFDRFVESADRGHEHLPEHLALNFEPRSAVPANIRKIAHEEGWVVASDRAWPWIGVIEPGLTQRDPSMLDVVRAQVVCRALTAVITDGELQSWFHARVGARTVDVTTSSGPVEVEVSMPSNRLEGEPEPHPFDAPLFDVHGELDGAAFEKLRSELMRRFAASPEAKPLGVAPSFANLLMLFASEELGLSVLELAPHQLRDFLREFVPQRVSLSEAEVPPLFAELRAFFSYLRRALRLRSAERCLPMLDLEAERRLVADLSAPRGAGLAKSLVAAGTAAGFDMTTQEGLDAFVQRLNRVTELGRASDRTKDKKKKRKAAAKARKRNR